MLGATILTETLRRVAFAPLTHGCPAGGANVTNTLEAEHFLDAAVCPYADIMTLPIFGAVVMLGVFNIPIYVRQESALMPFVISVLVGGVILSATNSMFQALVTLVILFAIGLGPVLLLMQMQR